MDSNVSSKQVPPVEIPLASVPPLTVDDPDLEVPYTIPASDDYAPATTEYSGDKEGGKSRIIMIAIGVGLALLVCLGVSLYFLLQPTTNTARIRDIFIIFMALETMLIGAALVVLVVQLARLINLLQNEVKPILESTSATVNHLKGTTIFLSENLAQPVIKLNEYMAGFSELLHLVGLTRKSKRK